MNISLTHSEQERIAYITGNSMLAAFAGDCNDQEALIDDLDDQIKAADTAGYDRGYLEGIGADTDTMLTAQRQEIARLKTEYMALKAYLAKVRYHLISDACKKVAGRDALSADITRQYIAAPRY